MFFDLEIILSLNVKDFFFNEFLESLILIFILRLNFFNVLLLAS